MRGVYQMLTVLPSCNRVPQYFTVMIISTQANLRRKWCIRAVMKLRRTVRATFIQAVWKMIPLRRKFVKQRTHAVVVQVPYRPNVEVS